MGRGLLRRLSRLEDRAQASITDLSDEELDVRLLEIAKALRLADLPEDAEELIANERSGAKTSKDASRVNERAHERFHAI